MNAQDEDTPSYPFETIEPTGLPYHIIISDLLINNVEAPNDSEIGIFNGDLCVGSGSYDPNSSIVVWEGDDSQSLQGFVEGDPIIIYVRHYLYSEWIISPAVVTAIDGDGMFGSGSYSVLNLVVETQDFPNITSNKTSINFNNIEVGSNDQDSVIIYNEGTATLNISSINSTNYQFTYSGQTGLIYTGDSIEIFISFTPNEASFETGRLEIYSDDPDSPVIEITLQGQGLPVSYPVLVCNGNVNFGSVHVGTSVTEELQLNNDGSEELIISSFSLSSESLPYTITEQSLIIAPGETYSLSITFSPSLNGNVYNQLIIESNAFGGNASTYINLNGVGYEGYFNPVSPTGLPYIIVVEDISIDNHGLSEGNEIGFFDIDNNTGEEICVGSYIFNNDNYPIQISVWESDENLGLNGFIEGNNITAKIWGSTYGSTLELIPDIILQEGDGTYGSGEFSVINLQSMSGLDPFITISNSNILFPPTELGISSTASIFIKNIGLSNLEVNNIYSSDNSFSVSPNYLNIAPQDSQEVLITFSPSNAIPYYSELSIYSNNQNIEGEIVLLEGQGIPSSVQILEVLSSSIEFPLTLIGDTSVVELLLFNSGSSLLTIFDIVLSDDHFFSGFTNFYIEPGQTMIIPIYFNPIDHLNEYNSQLEILSDSYGGSASTYLNLNGQGYQGFFNSIPPTGLPYTIILEDINFSNIEFSEGDEFGIFDDNIVVGSILYLNENTSGIAWENNIENGLVGFIDNNPITLRYFNSDNQTLHDLNYTVLTGDGNFGTPPFSVLSPEIIEEPLSIQKIAEIPDITIHEDSGPNIIDIDFGNYFISPFDTLSFSSISSDTSSLNIDIENANKLILDPKLNYNGEIDIYIFASNDYLQNLDTININVLNVNDAPTSEPYGVAEAEEDIIYNGTITGNDIDGDALEFNIVVESLNGIAQIVDATTGDFTYSPNSNFFGLDSFSYVISDGMDFSIVYTIVFEVEPVNDPPQSESYGIAEVIEDNNYEGQIIGYDVDDDEISYSLFENPVNGILNRWSTDNGEFTYIPNPNFFGQDSFSYIISDGDLESDVFTINIEVEPVNDAPTLVPYGIAEAEEDIVYNGTIPGDDIDGDALEFNIVVESLNGITEIVDANTGDFTYSPNSNFFGLDSFSYVISDGTLLSEIGKVYISVESVNDQPILNPIDDMTIDEDTILQYVMSSTDIDGDSIIYSAFINNPDFMVVVDSDTLEITPPLNWFGTVEVEVSISDFTENPLSDYTLFNLIVNEVDDLPFIGDNINDIILEEDFNNIWSIDLINYYFDIDGDLTFSVEILDTTIVDVEILNDSLKLLSLPDSNGTTQIIITAENPTRAVLRDTILVMINPVNDLPYFISPMQEVVGLNLEFYNIIEKNDIDSDYLNISLIEDNLYPDWLIFDNDTIKGIPTDLGFYDIPLELSDGDSSIIDTFKLNVENFKPIITDIIDIPQDQGGFVSLNFISSYFDSSQNNNQFYIVSRLDSIETNSNWVQLDTLYAIGDSVYNYIASTITDSLDELNNGLTGFKIEAYMTDGVFNSETIYGYSTDDIAPSMPTGVIVNQLEDNLLISWDQIEIEDIDYFSIYRSEDPDFEIQEENFIGYNTTDSTYLDSTAEWFTYYYYKLNATDLSGNTGVVSNTAEGFIYVNTAPVLSLIDSQYIDEDQIFELILDATDENQEDVLEYSVSSSFEEVIPTILGDTLRVELTENWYGISELLVLVTDGELYDSTSFVLVVNSVNDSPEQFSLITPLDSAYISITTEDIYNGINLDIEWEASSDPDEDELHYGFALYAGSYVGENSVILMDTLLNQNMLSIPYQLISNVIALSGDNNINGDWTVFVTDGMDTVMSNEIRNITIDASAVLSLEGEFLPLEFALHQNYPNPFNPTTQIKYDLPEDALVNINIYDVMGRSIKSLLSDKQSAGYRLVRWDATNNFGEPVSAGMYVYVIQAGEFRATKKMVLLK